MATLIASSEDVRIYECCVLLPFPLQQKEEQEIIKEVEKLFEEAGATQISKDIWGRRGLAYRIGGYDEGNYIVYYYEMDPSKLKELDTALRIANGVLRHMFVKPPKNYQIVNYSEAYQEWLRTREEDIEAAAQKKEDDLKAKVVKRATQQMKKVEKKEEEKPSAPIEKKKLDAKLTEIISDDDLDI